jgi:hypothetical protein
MDAITNDVWDAVLWRFWSCIWISAGMVWFRCLSDLCRDRTCSGWGKAGWVPVLILLSRLDALIYLIARGRMSEPRIAAVARQRSVQEACIHQVAGQTATPVGQIADAQASLEYGTVTESDTLQAKGPGLTGSGWSGLELAEDLNHPGGLLVTDFTRSYLSATNATPGGRPTEIPGFARSPRLRATLMVGKPTAIKVRRAMPLMRTNARYPGYPGPCSRKGATR